jgi:hypothetical protein
MSALPHRLAHDGRVTSTAGRQLGGHPAATTEPAPSPTEPGQPG